MYCEPFLYTLWGHMRLKHRKEQNSYSTATSSLHLLQRFRILGLNTAFEPVPSLGAFAIDERSQELISSRVNREAMLFSIGL